MSSERKSQQPVGRVSPQGVTRQSPDSGADVGLRCANPTYAAEWREIAFGDFVALQRGHDLPDQDRRPGKVPILGSFGVTGFHDTVKAKAPGVTVGRSGASFGVAAYTDQDYWPLNTALYVTDFKGNDPKFVFYFLKLFDFSGYNSGSAQPSLNRNNLYGIPIQIPAPLTQKHIAEFVSALDDRITLLRETNATLEAIAQALFKSWFVDFDPVHAKQQGRAPEGMDEATAALFPDSFEESERGLVPKGWQVQRLDAFMELSYGKALKANDRVPGVVPVYGSGGKTGFHNESLVTGPSVIVGRKGTVGSLYWEDQPFFPIDTVFYVRSSGPMTYCFYLLQTLGLSGMNTDAAVPGLNRNNVYRLKVTHAPEPVLSVFDDVACVIRDKIFGNCQQAQTLATFRDTLLPRLISGQLRLPEAEAMLGVAA